MELGKVLREEHFICATRFSTLKLNLFLFFADFEESCASFAMCLLLSSPENPRRDAGDIILEFKLITIR